MGSHTPLGRRFLTVWAGQALSTIGSTVSGVGIGVFVFVETGSAAWLGVLTALASLPVVLTSPLLSLTDRFARRSVMIAADAFAVVGPVVALLLAVTGQLEVWHLALAGFVGGVGNSFQGPAAQAAIPALVAPDALDRANGLSQLSMAGGIVIGPPLATPLVTRWGIEAVLIVDVVTFFVAIVATLAVRFSDVTDDSDVADDGTWAATRAWLRDRGRPLVTLLIAMAVVNFALAFFNVAVLVLATDLGGAARAGTALGAAGIAMVVGSLASARFGVADDRVKAIAVGLTVVGVGFVTAAVRPSFALLIVGAGVAFAAVPVVSAASATLFHEHVPASMQGRVFGVRAVLGQSLGPLGSLLAGFIIADVAAPAMRDDGVLNSTIGRLIGTGDARGAALVIAIVGVCCGAVACRLATSSIREDLRRDPLASDQTSSSRQAS